MQGASPVPLPLLTTNNVLPQGPSCLWPFHHSPCTNRQKVNGLLLDHRLDTNKANGPKLTEGRHDKKQQYTPRPMANLSNGRYSTDKVDEINKSAALGYCRFMRKLCAP